MSIFYYFILLFTAPFLSISANDTRFSLVRSSGPPYHFSINSPGTVLTKHQKGDLAAFNKIYQSLKQSNPAPEKDSKKTNPAPVFVDQPPSAQQIPVDPKKNKKISTGNIPKAYLSPLFPLSLFLNGQQFKVICNNIKIDGATLYGILLYLETKTGMLQSSLKKKNSKELQYSVNQKIPMVATISYLINELSKGDAGSFETFTKTANIFLSKNSPELKKILEKQKLVLEKISKNNPIILKPVNSPDLKRRLADVFNKNPEKISRYIENGVVITYNSSAKTFALVDEEIKKETDSDQLEEEEIENTIPINVSADWADRIKRTCQAPIFSTTQK